MYNCHGNNYSLFINIGSCNLSLRYRTKLRCNRLKQCTSNLIFFQTINCFALRLHVGECNDAFHVETFCHCALQKMGTTCHLLKHKQMQGRDKQRHLVTDTVRTFSKNTISTLYFVHMKFNNKHCLQSPPC